MDFYIFGVHGFRQNTSKRLLNRGPKYYDFINQVLADYCLNGWHFYCGIIWIGLVWMNPIALLNSNFRTHYEISFCCSISLQKTILQLTICDYLLLIHTCTSISPCTSLLPSSDLINESFKSCKTLLVGSLLDAFHFLKHLSSLWERSHSHWQLPILAVLTYCSICL